MPRPMRTTTNPLAQSLQEWWSKHGCERFTSMKRLARTVGVGSTTLSRYFNGYRACPRGEQRKRLYEVTGLDCLRGVSLAPPHRLKGTTQPDRSVRLS
jgi:hypothetical protein